MIQGKGLNGFWGNLWGGFTSVFTRDTDDDEVIAFSVGNMIGRRIGRFLRSYISAMTLGAFKIEYVPTAQDLLILNPLKTSLNNYMITLVNNLDAFFLANTNTQDRVGYLNNAIRKIQIVQSYFAFNSHPALSVNAQQSLSGEIISMIKSFELTIEELLEENGIEYQKTEGDLAVNPADTYPAGINIPANEYGYGYQYVVPNSETAIISTSVPTSSTNTNVSLIPNQATVITEEIAGLQTVKKSSMIIPALLVLIAAGIALMPSSKSKSEKEK